MPTTMKRVDTLGTLGNITESLPADRGRLAAVSCIIQETTIPDGQCYIRIGVTRTSGVASPVVTMLAAGYVSFLSPLLWQGSMPLEADMQVFIVGRSLADATMDFSIITDVEEIK